MGIAKVGALAQSRQRTQTTVLEGGIPPEATQTLHVIGADTEQTQPSTSHRPDADIGTVPVEASLAIPEAQEIHDPPTWPADMRGMPHYRPRQQVDFSTRPMGQNTPEFIFLTLMLSGVQALGYANTAWRQSFGRITDRVWKVPIGGSW